jgi:hypothetical protein
MSTGLRLTEEAGIVLDNLGSGVPMLLLHSFPSTRRLWKDVVPTLVDRGYRTMELNAGVDVGDVVARP